MAAAILAVSNGGQLITSTNHLNAADDAHILSLSCFLQFYDYVVLQHLRPIVPAVMPADYELLMEKCWAASPDDRPSIVRVLDCLDAMIEERALQAAAEEVQEAEAAAEEAGSAEVLRETPRDQTACVAIPTNKQQQQQQQQLPVLVAAGGSSHSSSSAFAATTAAGADKRRKRDALLTLLSPHGRQRRASGVQSHMMRSAGSAPAAAAAPQRDCNSEPLPPVLTSGGRGCSASSQHSGFNIGSRPCSETWLLQRSPASFSAGYASAGACMFSSSLSTSTCPPLLMMGDFEVEEEESSYVSETEQSGTACDDDEAGGVVGASSAGKGSKDDARKAVAASTAEDYFWVV
jgi:hypothetical protein